ncbi:hypothetical protein ElyMa_002535200 [Elysia marginata]|uniref:LRRNT domain-containing protein n=1 Tax=Elysia marginata TaxID=1093978 RepID=A0AAV4GVK8_9GAST|nr:hypothetical protein ElyMa_002535200 [Elysia marginata]
MEKLVTLQRLIFLMSQLSLGLAETLAVSYNIPGCTESCSKQVNCTVKQEMCSRDQFITTKDIPGAPTHLEGEFREMGDDQGVLQLTWRPPDDGNP